jgi:L-rhamnose mutarotase
MPKLGILMHLKPDCRQAYVEMHRRACVWREVLDVNRRAGVSREQIFLHANTIFLYAEARDIERMKQVYADDEGLARWNRLTFDMMVANSRDPLDVATELVHIYDYQDGVLLEPTKSG